MKYIKGADLSTLYEVERHGAKYFDNGVEKDPFEILSDYGFNAARLRLWNDPYSPDGKEYGAGTCDMPVLEKLAARVKKAGWEFLLDLHYSDFWTDPGKQIKPKAWEGLDDDGLCDAIYNFTKEVLLNLKEKDIFPTMIQIGNEVTNGLLWPNGLKPEYDNIARFISAGIKATREVDPSLPIMIHLDNGGNNELYRDWFDNYIKRGEDFDIIGLSYYPFWHGSLSDLSNNMNDIAVRYGKELIVAEVSMGFSMEDYAEYEKLSPEERKGFATRQELADKVPFPMTPEGQADFMSHFLQVIENVPENKGRGFYYWEPCWLPVPGVGWATEESLKYMNDKGPCGNEWANQALFDYEGNALPALKVIRDYKE